MTNLPTEVARLKRELAQVKKGQRLAHGASIENAAIEVRDDDGSLRAIVGQQGDGTTGAIIVNGPPPPQPSAPIVASVLGGVTASWDGLFAAGAVMPLDWARIEVHASTSAGFTPDPVTLQSTIETAQGATVVVACENNVYVRLVARTTSGTASAPSVIVGPYGPAPVVASDILDGIVTTVKLADDAVTAAKVAASAIGSTALADGAVLGAKLAAAAVSVGKIADNAVTGPAIASDAVTAGKVAADAITAREIAAGAVTAAEVAAGAITTDKLTVTGGANVLSDPSFEGAYTASLVSGLTYATQDTTKGNGSSASLRINAVAATATYRSVQLTLLPVLPGDQLALAVDYFVSTDWVGAEVNFQVRWETAAGGIISYGKASTTAPVRNAWTTGLAGTFTAPATATMARIRVESGAATAGTVWFDNASVRPVLPGTQIQDGAITTPKIVAGAVQTLQLDAEAVNASKIAAGAITTAKLAALAVTANELAANAVTASKILAGSVSAQALTIGVAQSIATKLTDTMADTSTWARVGETGTFTTVTGVTDAVAGSTVMQVSGPASMERTENIPYDAAALYRVTIRLRTTTAPTTGSATVYLGLTGIAADGTTRVNTAGANSITAQHFVALSNTVITAGTAWTTVTGYIQGTAATGTAVTAADPRTPGKAHTNVRYIRPLLRLLNGATGGVQQVDQVTVETVPTGAVNAVNIVDGAVTANAIAANTITAGKLAAGSVDATALKADAITGKTITGGTITGATVQTGTTGKRIVLNTSGEMTLYSGSGLETNPGKLVTDLQTEDGQQYGYLTLSPPTHHAYAAPELFLYLGADGTQAINAGPLHMLVDQVAATAVATVLGLLQVTEDLDVFGMLTAGNHAYGATTVTPSAASTPTSTTVFYSVAGTSFQGFATLNTTVPGVRTALGPTFQGVTGVSVSSVTASSMLVWVNRENTTATNVNWEVWSS